VKAVIHKNFALLGKIGFNSKSRLYNDNPVSKEKEKEKKRKS
jgi:hypothetical protein